MFEFAFLEKLVHMLLFLALKVLEGILMISKLVYLGSYLILDRRDASLRGVVSAVAVADEAFSLVAVVCHC